MSIGDPSKNHWGGSGALKIKKHVSGSFGAVGKNYNFHQISLQKNILYLRVLFLYIFSPH